MFDALHPTVEQPKLVRSQIEYVLCHAIRTPDVFFFARKHLKPEHFYSTEPAFKVIWETALLLEKQHALSFLTDSDGKKPYVLMYHVIAARFTNEPELAPPDQQQYAMQFLQYIFSNEIFNAKQAIEWLKVLLIDRTVQTPLINMLTSAGESVLANFPVLLQQAHDMAVATTAAAEDPVQQAFPVGFKITKVPKIPTGVDFIDKALEGGHARGEVHGILGAFGAGKTALAVQILSQCALQQVAQCAERLESTGEETWPDESFLFHYEAVTNEIWIRMVASLCDIDHKRLEELEFDQLSTNKPGGGGLVDYEKKYFRAQEEYANVPDELIMGEQERYLKYEALMQKHMPWIVDMSGTPKNPKLGTGYISEIRYIIQNKLRQLDEEDHQNGVKRPPRKAGAIVIDYAGLCCKRYMGENNISLDQMRHYVGGFGMKAREELAQPYDCPVWIFHQLSGQSNTRTFQSKQHYTDAAESKSFAENLHFCFALGTRDDESGCLLFTTSKARRASIQTPPVLTMEGQFFRLVVSNEYIYNPKTRKIERIEVFKGKVAKPVAPKAPVMAHNGVLDLTKL